MRFQHIDIAKGIGILLVIALHTDFHQEWMTTFEMPLFFLLSGLFVKIDMPFREYAIKKINTLLVPYIFFESPKLIYDAYFACRHDQISFLESYINSSLPTANWFLLAMFISQIMCYFILRLCRRNMWKIIVAFAAFGIGYALSLFKIPNYLFAGSAITLSSFLLLGNVFRNLIIVPFISGIFKPLLYGGVCLLVCFAVWEFQPSFIFYRSNIIEANMFLAFFMALIGSGGVIFVSVAIKRSKILEYYGRYSLIILGVHLYFILALQRGLHMQAGALMFLAICVVVVPAIHALKKYLPHLCGVKPLIK